MTKLPKWRHIQSSAAGTDDLVTGLADIDGYGVATGTGKEIRSHAGRLAVLCKLFINNELYQICDARDRLTADPTRGQMVQTGSVTRQIATLTVPMLSHSTIVMIFLPVPMDSIIRLLRIERLNLPGKGSIHSVHGRGVAGRPCEMTPHGARAL
jgi:hypothetical protein